MRRFNLRQGALWGDGIQERGRFGRLRNVSGQIACSFAVGSEPTGKAALPPVGRPAPWTAGRPSRLLDPIIVYSRPSGNWAKCPILTRVGSRLDSPGWTGAAAQHDQVL